MQAEELLQRATKNVRDIVYDAIEHDHEHRSLVVFDTENGLTRILTQAYRNALPEAEFVDFNQVSKEEILARFDALQPQDLVVMIQSSNFRLDEFRIRLHLFSKKLKVIEHMHLYRNNGDVWDVYIDALAYDKSWYRDVGKKLYTTLRDTKELQIESGSFVLKTSGGLEEPKLNIGDYAGMENIGGTFPIGEVFTEAKDFTQMNGSCLVYAFAGSDFGVNMHQPFRIDISEGIVVGWDDRAPQDFGRIIHEIRSSERALVREIGFGLNRAITRARYMEDITAFERILGLHLSLGEKHSVYNKPGIAKHKTKFHVDVFPVVDRVLADGKVVFQNDQYLLT